VFVLLTKAQNTSLTKCSSVGQGSNVCKYQKSNIVLDGTIVQWIACQTHLQSVMNSSPIKCPHCFFEQETLPSLLSTGWFQQWIHQLVWNCGSFHKDPIVTILYNGK